jgi:lipopolysaccharide transport system ATP-binding protein
MLRPPATVLRALSDVSLDLRRGEVLGIVGRNGAGKSTLLKILSRVTLPDTGYADLYGRVGSLLEVGTGFHPDLTGRENVYLNGAILGMTRREIDMRYDEIIAFAGLSAFTELPVKRFSSGMQVRLAFAVAAHLDADILIIDEALAVGDAEFQAKCMNKMSEVTSQEGRTVLFVSHNLNAIRSLCTRCVFLSDGAVVADGPTGEVVDAYLSSIQLKDARITFTDGDAAAAAQVELSGRTNHFGAGTIHIASVELAGVDGRPGRIFPAGDECTLTIDTRLLGQVQDPIVGVRLKNSLDESIATFTSRHLFPRRWSDVADDPELVRLRIPQLNLLEGEYWVDLSVTDGVTFEAADMVERAISLHVDSPPPDRYGGGNQEGFVYMGGWFEVT